MLRARQVLFAALALCLSAETLSGCSKEESQPTEGSHTTQLPTGSTHELADESGKFALPSPRLAKAVTIDDSVSGADPVKVRFSVAYAVANTSSGDGFAGDRAEVTLRVAPAMFTTGPQPNNQVFTKTLADEELDKSDITRDYEVDLPRDVHDFLVSKGIRDHDADTRAQALALVNVGVQQFRDFQIVDGTHDWIHGTTFNAAQSPTKASDNPGGSLTVRNDTGTGIYSYDYSSMESPAQQFGPGLLPDPGGFQSAASESTGVQVALGGQAVSCFYQGTDGSNPEGFNVSLAPGAAVTQTIVADDSSVNLPNDNTAAAAIADALEDTLKASVVAMNIAASIAFGGPFTLIVALTTNLLDFGSYCNNQPNLMQLGAVTEDGLGTSNTTWAVWDGCGGTCGGLANYYTSPWGSSAPNIDANVVNNAVQLAPDSGQTYQGQPLWLTQSPIQGCGIGDASNSNTSGCTSQNVISLRWTTEPACPWTNGLATQSGSKAGDVSWCYLPAPQSPEVEACGTNNAQCLSYEPS